MRYQIKQANLPDSVIDMVTFVRRRCLVKALFTIVFDDSMALVFNIRCTSGNNFL